MTDTETGSPGSHLPNWRPGDDDAHELHLQKLRDALRDGKSDRQIAKLLGVNRMMLWRMKTLGAMPEGLADRLVAAGVGMRAMIYIARICADPLGGISPEVECCPNCGHRLRTRNKSIMRALDIAQAWQDESRADPSPAT
jgi:hypothetical protein